MGTLADLLIPLAGSISNEKALKMREACDLLESRVDINQRGTNHAHDLISLLTDRVKELERDNLDRRLTKLERAVDVLDRQRVETLNLRVNGLESMVLELRDATKNIAVATDETLRAVRLNAGEGFAAGQNGSMTAGASRPHSEAPAPSPASSVPAPATGEVPKWVPSPRELVLAHYQGIKENLDAEHVWDHVRRLIAIRAPAAPVVDVERLIQDYIGDRDSSASDAMTRALAAQGVRAKDGA